MWSRVGGGPPLPSSQGMAITATIANSPRHTQPRMNHPMARLMINTTSQGAVITATSAMVSDAIPSPNKTTANHNTTLSPLGRLTGSIQSR